MTAPIDPKTLETAIRRYKGEPQYAPGQTNTKGRLICGAKKRGKRHGQGDPCQNSPVHGGVRCGTHGGKAPRAKEAAKTRTMHAEAKQILGHIDPNTEPLHPVQHLLNLINQKAAEVAWLRTKVQALTEEQLTWGVTKHETGIEKGEDTDIRTFETQQNIWWKLLREAEEQLAKWAAMAARAGVEERLVRLEQEKGQLVVSAIQQILDGLQLNPKQKDLVSTVVPAALRALGTGGKP